MFTLSVISMTQRSPTSINGDNWVDIEPTKRVVKYNIRMVV